MLKSHTAISRAPQTEKATVLGGIWVQIAKRNYFKKKKSALSGQSISEMEKSSSRKRAPLL